MFDKIDNVVSLAGAIGYLSYRFNCELDSSLTYTEQADFFEREMEKTGENANMRQMADALREAEKRWFELEQANG